MKWMHRISGIFVAVCLLSVAQSAQAALKYSRVSAGWNTASTWSTAGCGGAANTTVPGAADDVTICTGHAITTNANSSALSLVIQTGGTLTQATNRSLTIGVGGLSVDGTLTSRNTLTVNGATSVSGTLQVTSTSGSKTFVGAVTINPGGIWSSTVNESFIFRGGITHNGATFTSGTGTYTFQTNSQAIGGSSPITFGGVVAVSGAITLTNNNTGGVTIVGNLTGNNAGSTWVNAANSTLNYGGTAAPMGTRVFTASAVPNTVNYTRAGAQTAKVTTYDNLTLSGSGAKTFATTPTVNGVLSMEGTATVVVTGAGVVTYGPAATLQYNTATARTVTSEEWVTPFAATGGVIIANTGTITLNAAKVLNASVPLTINSGAMLANGAFALSVAGNFTQNGTFTAGTGVFTFNGGAAVQTISGTGPLGFANLTVNNTGGITLARNVTVTSAIIGAVTLTNTCPTDYTLTSNGGATVAHSCNQPVVISINLASANPTVAASVDWTVTFNQNVTGVSTSNFTLVNGGLGGAPAITLVSGSGTTWTVTASTGTGTGTLGLNMTNVTGISPAVITPMPFTGQVYSVRPPTPVIYYHDTTLGVNVGFDGLTNVTGANQVIPPIITASLNLVSTCPVTRARSNNHPTGLYTHSRWYLNTDYAVATNIGANPTGSASLRGGAVTDTVIVSLYDYDPVTGAKVLIGSSAPITLTGGGTTTTYLYTITSALYTVPAGHRLMLEYNFNQPVATYNARVYCSAIASFVSVTETPAPVAPVAEYRMDEGIWNGTANEVGDSSGNALHGTALLGATPATAKICNGANLAANYVEVPDNALLDIPTTLTVTAWIKPARWGGAPGDALMSFLSKDGNYEAHVTSTGQINWWWTSGSLTSAATAPIGAWTHVAMVYASGSQTLYVNGVSSATGTVAGALPVNAMPFQIGNDQEFGGGTRRFDGMIDEVKIFNIALTPAQISTGYTNENAGNNWDGTARICVVYAPHHLEIQHASGTGVTCTPSTLTIKACADNAVPCTPYTSGVSGTLSATGAPTVNWDGTTGGAAGADFVIPNGSSTVTKNVQVTTPGSVVFDATSTPAPAAATICDFGAPSCTFTAADAGFLVSASNHVAETASTLTVQAVRKADNSLVCVPAFANAAKTVNLKCSYVNPATGTLPVRVGGAALNAANDAAAACDAGGANVSLNFDASGIATPSLQYADVGEMQVSAGFTGTPGSLDEGLVMTGSGNFIAAPASFAFSGITAGPIKAGDPFGATVTALNAASAATPNFGKEGAPEGVTLGTNLVSPAGGSNPPLGNNVIGGGTFTNGAATVANLSWDEAGSIELTATLTSGNYLGSGVAAATGTSATVGAFIPHHFDTAVVPTATLPMPCPTGLTCPLTYDGFVYSGQPFSVQITARNLAGGTTTNYDGVFGISRNVTLTAWDAKGGSTQNPGSGVLGGNAVASTAFISGIATLIDTPAYTFDASPTAPTDIYVRATDTDGVTSLRTTPSDSVEGGVKVASGRVKIGNAHGSELLDLPMSATVQYYDGTYWTTSATDDVTSFDTTLSTSGGNLVATIISGLGGGITVSSPGTAAVVGGVRTFRFAAPGVRGSANISLNAPAYLPSNIARATFGVYKGNNEFIYLRETY